MTKDKRNQLHQLRYRYKIGDISFQSFHNKLIKLYDR